MASGSEIKKSGKTSAQLRKIQTAAKRRRRSLGRRATASTPF